VPDDATTSAPGSREPSEGSLPPGRVFADHRIEYEAGRGGMGTVYAAVHLRLRVTRALKVLNGEGADDSIFRARFERESQLAAALEHPNVVQVYEAGESDGTLYLSMRFVDGPNLSEVLASQGRLPAAEAADLITQLAAGLDAAHEHGLVHRDVKPANVLLERGADRERVFLGDFGISRLLTGAAELTETGEMLGTVNYVAPEQIAGAAVDARTDVYSLACVAFEALTGAPPFERETQLATLFAHANDPRPSASAQNPELPSTVDRVLARALAVQPRGRYDHASEFAHDLARAVAGERVSARADRRLLGGRRRAAIAAGVLALVIGIAVLAVLGVFGGSERGSSAVENPQSGQPQAVPAPPARAVATVDVARDPVAIALGTLNVWVASASGGAISPIVPADNDRARPPIPIGGRPESIVAGFGSVWVADRRGNALLRLDPGQGGASIRIPVGAHPSAVAASSRYLWVTNQADDTVSRVDPSTNRVDATAAVGKAPKSVVVGEGGVWIADSGSGAISELDPASAKPRGFPVHVGGTPTSLAAGEAGVWVVDAPQGRLVRISPGSREVSPQITAGLDPTSVATGFGYAWVTFADGTVRRVDPTRLLPAGDPIPVGRRPSAIAAGNGFVWAVNSGDSTVTRIQPRAAAG
jgi:YVTN family beta-propeller protein